MGIVSIKMLVYVEFYVIGITTYGASAPYKENFKHYGFTAENIVSKAKELF